MDVNHIWAAAVAFMYKGIPYVSTHHATPFGATSSVWSWERVGAAITHMARVILKIPAHRYVDDLFGADRFVACLLSLSMCKYAAHITFACVRKECAEHAMKCVRRLVEALLGHGAVADKKAEWGISLQILGVDVAPEVSGYKCKLSKKKAEKCAQMIEAALSTKVLQPGCAMKLAGRLSWATQFLFKRLGRAMLRPIFKQAYSRCAAMML